jgi:site-specific DNA-cytosine methylase
MQEYKVYFPFGGSGGGAVGFQRSRQEYKGIFAGFKVIGGFDVDPMACADFEALTGVPEAQLDLFSRQDYIEFHGKEPAEDWQEMTSQDILDSAGGEFPDVVFLSPPCKGFSGLLPEKSAKSQKYQALNRLTIRGIQVTLDAFQDNLPGIILFENVPRIKTRGELFLKQIKRLLKDHGYAIDDRFHDCGEIGGLGQHRKRYLLIARHKEKVSSYVYQPPKKRVKSIGEIIGPLPMPDDPAAGPMHRLPRLKMKTWIRLALIPAGGDWRDLENINPAQYRLEHIPRKSTFGVQDWNDPAGAVIGNARVGGSQASAINDPRLPGRDNRHPGVYQIVKFDEPAPCVTGTRFGSGAPAISDPRTSFKDSTHHAIYKVSPWDEPAGTVFGANRPNNGAICIADPRINKRGYSNNYQLLEWNNPASTVTGIPDIQSGAQSIADPRGPIWRNGWKCTGAVGRINEWDKPTGTVIGHSSARGNGASCVSDPRLGCSPRNGTMGIQKWDKPSSTVIGAGDIHAGVAAVADPRIPDDNESGTWMIIALDGTWHRPLTTLELAALQSFPLFMPDGRPLQLAGNSDARWRERIGNAVPPDAAEAMGNEALMAFMLSKTGDFLLSNSGIWVMPGMSEEELQVVE